MSLYSRTVDYINSNDFSFTLEWIQNRVYTNGSVKTSTVRQYVHNLVRCGFLIEKGKFNVVYKRKKHIPPYITTTLIDIWSKTLSDEKRINTVERYCRIQDRKLKIKKLLDESF